MLLKWQAKKLGFQGLRDLLNSGMKKAFETFYQTTVIRQEKGKCWKNTGKTRNGK